MKEFFLCNDPFLWLHLYQSAFSFRFLYLFFVLNLCHTETCTVFSRFLAQLCRDIGADKMPFKAIHCMYFGDTATM